MYVNLFFDGLSNGELLTFKTGPPCIEVSINLCYSVSIMPLSQ